MRPRGDVEEEGSPSSRDKGVGRGEGVPGSGELMRISIRHLLQETPEGSNGRDAGRPRRGGGEGSQRRRRRKR